MLQKSLLIYRLSCHYKNIQGKLYELRFFFSRGYRIYFTEKNNEIILLLNAGDKDTQSKDIKKALEIMEEIYK
ncbi:type II toxin-antitoxin system RelE/ParE family toxin [Rickettsia bellii]|uniref:Addiction module killer protein n=2 Tax=Rickettsia bellii TaxID=33990 RepID=Q1RHK3_RICBR|nr:type II toxin-antitoxin system RelE/ParE family toxin [Rickettsia bellii]ABE05161.1 unknown [Rickettsia bellii RML369-C]ABV78771.1 hypothetical protein A1I_01935 [Rickettsia bellii OSU 85-389]KJV89269.1 hypothetical protein RBEAN4_0240 [Rickettsia bellii str. RML An4]